MNTAGKPWQPRTICSTAGLRFPAKEGQTFLQLFSSQILPGTQKLSVWPAKRQKDALRPGPVNQESPGVGWPVGNVVADIECLQDQEGQHQLNKQMQRPGILVGRQFFVTGQIGPIKEKYQYGKEPVEIKTGKRPGHHGKENQHGKPCGWFFKEPHKQQDHQRDGANIAQVKMSPETV